MTSLAITGGTGFVGSTLIRLALEQGHGVRALARRPQPAQPGVTWVPGALDDPASLTALMDGADAVIHVAGCGQHANARGLYRGQHHRNRSDAGGRDSSGRSPLHPRFLAHRTRACALGLWLVQGRSRSARCASGLDWTMVRPPAIYGPGDLDQLDLFKSTRFGIMPLPPHGRLSLIEVSDLARLLLALIPAPETFGHIYEADDGAPGGWTHEDYGRAIGAAMGRRVLALSMPGFFLRLGARADRLWRRDKAKLTADRAAYFCHPDWVITPAARPPASLWTPQVETQSGLKATADWYRTNGWI
jgi:nucleoside-diphosphate-sugar epimerase